MNRLRWWLFVCIVVAGTACSDKKKAPRGILPRDKMEELVWDMAQAEQYATLYLAKDSSKINLKVETMRLYEEVFRLHHTTREEFTKSYRYYLDHPVLDQILFDSVVARGARARTDMYDRPFYHPPAPPVVRPPAPSVPPGKGRPQVPALLPVKGGLRSRIVTPGKTPGTGMSPRPFEGTPAGQRLLPRAPGTGMTPEEMRRAHQAAMLRSEDSVARALHARFDTTRKRH